MHAHEKIENLFSIEGGAQEMLVDGGMGAFAERLAADLGGTLRLGSPARAITQHGDRVVVETGGTSVSASFAVVTVPPVLAVEIAFDPGLPEDRASLYRNAVAGVETKSLVLYDEPFWRAEGLSGQSAEAGSPSEVTIDASPFDGAYGVLASFTFGSVATAYGTLAEKDPRDTLVDTLTARFGPRAAAPVEIVDTAWFAEPWSLGCSMAHFPVSFLTRYGHLLREPFGLVHWAGTETATVSHGAVDGAIRSGERVATEILERVEAGTARQVGKPLD